MSNPHQPSKVGVTIKVPESARYKADNPWFVFEGDPDIIRENIAKTFGITDDFKSLAELVIEAQSLATALGNAASGVGGRPVGQSQQQSSGGSSGSSSWSQAKSDEPPQSEPAVNPLIEAIEGASTRDELKRIWAENKAEFDSDADLMAAWKAKGKSLAA